MSKSYQEQYADVTRRLMTDPFKVGQSRIGDINSNFCEQLRVDLTKEFPLQEIKKIKFSNIVHELLWMIRGDTNIKYLIENDCKIWTDDSIRYFKEKYPLFKDKELNDFINEVYNQTKILEEYKEPYVFGDLDRIYGFQWRNFNGKTDQLQICIDTLKTNPDDRRMIVVAHNPTDIQEQNVGLPSCHNMFQFYTTVDHNGQRYLSTFVNIRSNDWFLGQPYNMAQYALLTHIVARIVNMKPYMLVINSVDAHLYHAHFEAAEKWLKRYDEKVADGEDLYCKSSIKISDDLESIDDVRFDDVELNGYDPESFIKAPLLT